MHLLAVASLFDLRFSYRSALCAPLQGAIIIHEVYEEGAASKDGRLWAGDQILDVRRKGASHTSDATDVLLSD